MPEDSPSKARKDGQKRISASDLARFYHLCLNDVAKEFGVCVTVLKRVCRRCGIKRWPYRKIKSLERSIETLQETAHCADPSERARISLETDELRKKRELLLCNPNYFASEALSSHRRRDPGPKSSGPRARHHPYSYYDKQQHEHSSITEPSLVGRSIAPATPAASNAPNDMAQRTLYQPYETLPSHRLATTTSTAASYPPQLFHETHHHHRAPLSLQDQLQAPSSNAQAVPTRGQPLPKLELLPTASGLEPHHSSNATGIPSLVPSSCRPTNTVYQPTHTACQPVQTGSQPVQAGFYRDQIGFPRPVHSDSAPHRQPIAWGSLEVPIPSGAREGRSGSDSDSDPNPDLDPLEAPMSTWRNGAPGDVTRARRSLSCSDSVSGLAKPTHRDLHPTWSSLSLPLPTSRATSPSLRLVQSLNSSPASHITPQENDWRVQGPLTAQHTTGRPLAKSRLAGSFSFPEDCQRSAARDRVGATIGVVENNVQPWAHSVHEAGQQTGGRHPPQRPEPELDRPTGYTHDQGYGHVTCHRAGWRDSDSEHHAPADWAAALAGPRGTSERRRGVLNSAGQWDTSANPEPAGQPASYMPQNTQQGPCQPFRLSQPAERQDGPAPGHTFWFNPYQNRHPTEHVISSQPDPNWVELHRSESSETSTWSGPQRLDEWARPTAQQVQPQPWTEQQPPVGLVPHHPPLHSGQSHRSELHSEVPHWYPAGQIPTGSGGLGPPGLTRPDTPHVDTTPKSIEPLHLFKPLPLPSSMLSTSKHCQVEAPVASSNGRASSTGHHVTAEAPDLSVPSSAYPHPRNDFKRRRASADHVTVEQDHRQVAIPTSASLSRDLHIGHVAATSHSQLPSLRSILFQPSSY